MTKDDAVEQLRRRLGPLDPRQIAAWRQMTSARRLDLAFQAYQFALDIVRLTERRRHPHLSPDELNWRVTRRMQGDSQLGREEDIRDSLQRSYPFNVIQPTTGAKVDIVPLPRDPFTQAAFRRRQRLEYDEFGHSATFITPEDIVLAKLTWRPRSRNDGSIGGAF